MYDDLLTHLESAAQQAIASAPASVGSASVSADDSINTMQPLPATTDTNTNSSNTADDIAAGASADVYGDLFADDDIESYILTEEEQVKRCEA